MSDEFYELIPKKSTIKMRLQQIHDNIISFHHGYIAIHNYRMGDNREFEKDLSVFNDNKWRYEFKGGYYIKELHELRINRAYDVSRLAMHFKGYQTRVINDSYPADKVDIKLLVPPKDDFQRVGITFTCSQEEYKKNSRYTQMLIAADVGLGKTYLGIATSCFMQARTIIVVPFETLLEQWKSAYLKFTDLKREEIKLVQGSDTCEKIAKGKYRDVKVFIFSIDTIVSYCDRYGPLETIEMLRSTNCYLKIVDEVHKDMKAVSLVEALSNFHMNLYMSASPGRTAKKENWMFKCLFKNMPKFGSEFRTKSEEHINVIVKRYKFEPTAAQQKRMVNARKGWLSSKQYEKELFASPDDQKADFVGSLTAMLRWSKGLLKKNNKILILCDTVDGTQSLKEIAEEIFPGEVSRHYGSMKPADKEAAKKCTVICATIGSLGTGADIQGVQHVYNITTYTNWISVIQTPGRARKLDDGTAVFYIELVNMSYIKTLRQYEKRKPELVKRSRTGKIIFID